MEIIFSPTRSVPNRYLEKLVKANVFSAEEAKNTVQEHNDWLNQALKEVDNYIPQPAYFAGLWKGIQQADASVTQWDTGVDINLLRFIAEKSVCTDDDSVRSHCMFASHSAPDFHFQIY